MIPQQAYDAWIPHSGLADWRAALGQDRVAAAERRFAELVALDDADAIRKALADAPVEANIDLTRFLLGQVIDHSRATGLEEDDEPLIEWGLLTERYTGLEQADAATGHLLKGICLHRSGRRGDATKAYRDSLEAHELLSERPESHVFCVYCDAKLEADQDDLQEADQKFAKAQALIEQAGTIAPFWPRFVEEQRSRCRQYDELAQRIVAEREPAALDALLKKEEALLDDDFVELLESRVRRVVVRNEDEAARNAAANVDAVLAFRGQERAFQREVVQYYLGQNQYAQAEAVIRNLLALTPDDEELRFWLARCLQQQTRFSDSAVILKEILRINPRNSGAHRDLAYNLYQLGDWNGTRAHLDETLELDPDDAMAQLLLKSLPTASIGYNRESKTLTLGGDIGSVSPDSLGESIMAALIAGNPEKAEEFLQEIARDKGEEVARRVARQAFPGGGVKAAEPDPFEEAEHHFGKREFPKAIEAYKKAIAANPKHAPAYMGLGDTYYMLGDFNLAAAYFEESVSISPAASTYRFLGNSYEQLGKIDAAIAAYRNAIATDPNYAPAKVQLERALQRTQKDR